VLPDCQRLGIGSALVRHSLAAARQLGHRVVVVLGHAEYYPRFGFVPALPHGIEAPFPVRDESWMVCELVPNALRGVSGTVHYAAPFTAA
jgi:putative acetyltransferase